MRDRLRRWWLEPIIIPRWAMLGFYALTALLGAVVSFATAPSLEEATSAWYSSAWGASVAILAAIATLGAVRNAWWRVEAVGATGVFALMVTYAISPIVLILQGDLDRLAYSIIATGYMLLPLARLLRLIRAGGADG